MRFPISYAIVAHAWLKKLYLFSKKNDDIPDIVLLDILRLMRNNFSLSIIPVLVVPAKSTPADINYGRTAGASSFFTKPIGFQELNEAVERALWSSA